MSSEVEFDKSWMLAVVAFLCGGAGFWVNKVGDIWTANARRLREQAMNEQIIRDLEAEVKALRADVQDMRAKGQSMSAEFASSVAVRAVRDGNMLEKVERNERRIDELFGTMKLISSGAGNRHLVIKEEG